jgi:hypothetical protein
MAAGRFRSVHSSLAYIHMYRQLEIPDKRYTCFRRCCFRTLPSTGEGSLGLQRVTQGVYSDLRVCTQQAGVAVTVHTCTAGARFEFWPFHRLSSRRS